MRVLLVEDDMSAARGIRHMLKAERAAVDHAASGEEAIEMARHYEYDIVLLELSLPDIDGYEVVRRMRAARNATPVIVLSRQARSDTKVRVLDAGADDFMTKPLDNAELLARVQAIVRRSKGYSQPTLRVGSLELNLANRTVVVAGQPVHLTGMEYAALELLVMRKGNVLTKETFLSHLYGGGDEPEMKIIDVFICKLRKKLAAAGAPALIATVWGRGYTIRDPETAITQEYRGGREAADLPEMAVA